MDSICMKEVQKRVPSQFFYQCVFGIWKYFFEKLRDYDFPYQPWNVVLKKSKSEIKSTHIT